MRSPRIMNTLSKYLFWGMLTYLVIGTIVGLLGPARVTFIGPAYRTLRFQVVDQSRVAPIAVLAWHSSTPTIPSSHRSKA